MEGCKDDSKASAEDGKEDISNSKRVVPSSCSAKGGDNNVLFASVCINRKVYQKQKKYINARHRQSSILQERHSPTPAKGQPRIQWAKQENLLISMDIV